MFFFLAFLLVLPVWMRGGTRFELLGPTPWLALAALAAMLFRPPAKGGEPQPAARMRVWRDLLGDPLLYVGLGFLFLLAVQWLNGPRELVFDKVAGEWVLQSPPRAELPLFCVDRDQALEMLYWFVPFYGALLVIRNGLLREQKLDLLKLLGVNAAAAAAFGLVQYFTRTDRIFWAMPAQKSHFFAAFGYQNHAGAFFVLGVVLLLGLLLRELLRKQWRQEMVWLIPALAACLLAAVFSRSRAALLMVGILVPAAAGYGLLRVGHRHGRAAAASVLVSVAAAAGVALYVIFVLPANPVLEEMKGTAVDGMVARVKLEGDPLKQAALAIWREHPLFGVGGQGFSHFLYRHYPQRGYMPGQANVHHDPLQFLTEFGLAGAVLLALTVLLLLVPSLRAILRIRGASRHDTRGRFLKIPPLGVALLLGAVLTAAHSLVDLPFRSPAILWTWGALLACAPDFCKRSRGHHGKGRGHAAGAHPEAEDEPDEPDRSDESD